MQKRKNVTRTVAAAVAFTMALTMASGVKVDAAKKKPALNKKTLSLQVGETAKLKVVKNKNKISAVTWKTSKKKVATVKKGTVTAKSAGSAVVKAIFKVKGAKKKTTLKCKVTVKKNEPAPIVGGWGAAEEVAITPELAELVNQFVSGDEGAKDLKITPYALLAVKAVSGMGYRILCQVDFASNTSAFSILELYTDASGNFVRDASSVIAYGQEFDPNGAPDEGGKFVKFDDPEIPEESRTDFYNFFTEKGINFPYTPIARVASRTVGNQTEVILVCENDYLPENSGNVGTKETIGYFTISMILDENKKHTGVSPMIFPLSFKNTTYEVAGITGGLDAHEVEAQAAMIRANFLKLLLEKDATAVEAIAAATSFPVLVDGEKYDTLDQLKAAFVTKTVSEDFIKGVATAVPMQMWSSAEGIRLGENIWLNQDVDGKIKISALNGMFAA